MHNLQYWALKKLLMHPSLSTNCTTSWDDDLRLQKQNMEFFVFLKTLALIHSRSHNKIKPYKDSSGALHLQFLIGLYNKPSEWNLTHVQSQEENLR